MSQLFMFKVVKWVNRKSLSSFSHGFRKQETQNIIHPTYFFLMGLGSRKLKILFIQHIFQVHYIQIFKTLALNGLHFLNLIFFKNLHAEGKLNWVTEYFSWVTNDD